MINACLRHSVNAIVAAILTTLAAAAQADAVALVTDVSGRASIRGKPATILAEIEANANVLLESGASLVAIYIKSGEEYTFSGPGQFGFRADSPQTLRGTAPQKRPNPLSRAGKEIVIKPLAVTQAAYVMRGTRASARIKLLALSDTRTLDRSPEFRWQEVEPGARYRFELTDDAGTSLYEQDVVGNLFRLPPSVRLRDGGNYTWEVSTRLSDGRRYVSTGDFNIATAELRARVAALRPRSGSPVSERVAFAAWLQQMELKDEAREYWRALALERPEDAKLKALASE